MSLARVEAIANAVLYEGYALYPYRPGSVKNRQRFNFGLLAPRAVVERADRGYSWHTRTEILVQGNEHTVLSVTIRFLQLTPPQTSGLPFSLPAGPHPPPSLLSFGGPAVALAEAGRRELTPTPSLGFPCPRSGVAAGAADQPEPDGWLEATERVVQLAEASVADLALRGDTMRTPFIFDSLMGQAELSAESLPAGGFRVCVRVANNTPAGTGRVLAHNDLLPLAFLSTHSILSLADGDFVSLLEPPDEWREAAAACTNTGAFPVLVGEPGRRDVMLSSPIILYDYPEVAPESPGDLFDGAEIDEILTLRILTLTDEEKAEMRSADDRTRQLLERTEALTPQHMMKLHAVMRGGRTDERGR